MCVGNSFRLRISSAYVTNNKLHNYGKRQGTLKNNSEWRGEWRMARRLANGELRMANGAANIEYGEV